jgi:parafibromin
MDRKDLLEFIRGGQSQFVMDSVFGFDLNAKKFTNFDDVAQMARIKSIQRTFPPSQQKSFEHIQASAYKSLVLGQKSVKSTPVKQKSIVPIIIVPAAASSMITLYNVKDFLVGNPNSSNSKEQFPFFKHSDEYRKLGIEKPTLVVLERPKSFKFHKFEVYDSVDSFTRDHWGRIAAVFTSGQEWQFKGWKWDKPVDVFHNGLLS